MIYLMATLCVEIDKKIPRLKKNTTACYDSKFYLSATKQKRWKT